MAEQARIVGTQAPVICLLEDADYEGHCIAMLPRLTAALKNMAIGKAAIMAALLIIWLFAM